MREVENLESDMDVLMEFDGGANLFHFVVLSLFLEDKLHLSVDIFPVDSIREEIKDCVLKEVIPL